MVGRKNPVAKDLRTAKYRKRIVQAKRGKGSYNRKENRRLVSRPNGDFPFWTLNSRSGREPFLATPKQS